MNVHTVNHLFSLCSQVTLSHRFTDYRTVEFSTHTHRFMSPVHANFTVGKSNKASKTWWQGWSNDQTFDPNTSQPSRFPNTTTQLFSPNTLSRATLLLIVIPTNKHTDILNRQMDKSLFYPMATVMPSHTSSASTHRSKHPDGIFKKRIPRTFSFARAKTQQSHEQVSNDRVLALSFSQL